MELRTWWPLGVVAVLLVVGSGGANSATSPAQVVLAAAMGAAAVAAIVLARWRARTSVLLAGALATAYFAIGLEFGPVFLAVPLAAALAAPSARPRMLVPALVGGVALVALGLVLRELLHDRGDVVVWPIVGETALTAAAAALGWWWSGRAEVRAQQAERAAAEERLRMAQELHDGVGHGLAVIAMQAGVALHVLDQDPVKARQSLLAIRDTSRESLEALRTELARMSGRPASRRPAPGTAELGELVDRVRAGGLVVDCRGDADDLPEPVGRAAYAVVQESLTNVLRHARASRAVVSLDRRADRLVVSVTDDGRGPIGDDAGMGLAGMRSRVEALGGSFAAGAAPGRAGFRVRAELPLGAP